jgi:DNA-binding CsgD family transcriptional regulator
LAPWSEILAATTDPSEIEPADARSLLPVLPVLTSRAGNIEAPALTPDQERFRLFDATTRALTSTRSRRPVVVVLDDIQWADSTSLALARHVAWFAPRAPILLLFLERTGESDRSPEVQAHLSALRVEAGATHLALGGLDSTAVAALIGAGTSFNQTLSESLTEHTSGNPFFIEELIHNVVADVDATPRLTASNMAIPDGVRQVVERRLQRLSEPTRAMLQQAAIFTNGVDFEVLARLTEFDDDALLNAIDEALAANLIMNVPGGLERYDFVHAIVRQALVESWNPSRRVRLHRRAATALESAYTGRLTEIAAELAVQYHRSQSLPGFEAGVEHALLAANTAARSFAADQVVTFLRIARDLAPASEMDVQAHILGRLTVAEAETVQMRDSLATLDAFLDAAERSQIDRLDIATVLNDVARALKYSAYAEEREWRPVVERGLRLTSPDDGRIWARLSLLLDPVKPISRTAIRAGRWLGFDRRATSILQATGNEDDFARSVESFDAISRGATDDYLTKARGWTSPTAVMYGLTVAANHLQYRHGAFRDARRLWLELIERSSQVGAIHWEQQATNQLTYLLIAEGAFAEAQTFEERSNELAARLGPGQNPAGHQLEMATCRAIYQGAGWKEVADAWRAMLDDPALGPHDLSTLTGAYYGGLAAYCAAQADDHEGSRRLLALLQPILLEADVNDCNLNGAVAFAAGAAWVINEASDAPLYRSLISRMIETGIGDYPQTSLHLALGQMEALLDRKREAESAFAQARQTVRESGQLPLVPIVDYSEALALFRFGDASALPQVNHLLDSARAGFLSYQMTPWITDSDLLLEQASARFGRSQTLPGAITEREADVLKLIARGHSDRQISDELFISPRTVNAHVRNMLSKTDTANRVELAMWARSNGIVSD